MTVAHPLKTAGSGPDENGLKISFGKRDNSATLNARWKEGWCSRIEVSIKVEDGFESRDHVRYKYEYVTPTCRSTQSSVVIVLGPKCLYR